VTLQRINTLLAYLLILISYSVQKQLDKVFFKDPEAVHLHLGQPMGQNVEKKGLTNVGTPIVYVEFELVDTLVCESLSPRADDDIFHAFKGGFADLRVLMLEVHGHASYGIPKVLSDTRT
jgi:hypothetical protein